MQKLSFKGSLYLPIAIIAIVIVIAIGAFLFLNKNSTANKSTNSPTATLSTYCVGKSLTSGNTGHCVRDAQTLINYMEHSGLTECPFIGGETLSVNGAFDSDTSGQVLAVQHWAGCYAQQEGFTSNVKQTGSIDKTTWGELCTYSYTDPMHTSAKGASEAITAGKDAGCAKLQS